MPNSSKDEIEVLKSITLLIPGHVYWKNTEGKYIGCNNEQAIALGLSSPEEIQKKVPYENLPEVEAKKLRAVDARVLKEGKTITLEEAGIRNDGSLGVFLTKKTPLKSQAGDVIGLLGSSIDITRRKELEEIIKEDSKNHDPNVRFTFR